MIRSSTFAGQRVAVFGLGGSGLTSAQSLIAGGAEVIAWDDGEAGRSAAARADPPIPLGDLREADWSGIAALVLAPGVPLTHPEPHWVVRLAQAESERRRANRHVDHLPAVEIIGDVELFCRERAAFSGGVHSMVPFIAITGTNGKSTTTALVSHILRAAGCDVQIGGNIGVPILALEPLARGRFYVIEMSSFQIDLTPSLAPTVGVLLNITPDHLDRHGTLLDYARTKARLIEGAVLPVVGSDAAPMLADIASLDDNPLSFDAGDLISGSRVAPIHVADGLLKVERSGSPDAFEVVADLRGVGSLRGAHNGENAAAAFAALRTFLEPHVIAQHMATFPGLAHRLERVGRVGDVWFVNDSKATNADSAEMALRAYPSEVFWIVGGKPKDGGIDSLRPFFPGIVRAYLIGEASDAFAITLDGHADIVRCGTLDVAVARAAADAAAYARREPFPGATDYRGPAEPAPIVLLSPACASFDQFANFEKRGDAFRALVANLLGFVAAADAAASTPASQPRP